MVLLVVLVLSILVFFIGTFTTEKNDNIGFTGYKKSTFNENLNGQYDSGETFISVFAIFFPAVTGEMAGANISGDLRNPSKSIPLGTLTAIALSGVVYIAIAWVLGSTVDRNAVDGGLLEDFQIMTKIALWQPLVILGIFASTLSSGFFMPLPSLFLFFFL